MQPVWTLFRQRHRLEDWEGRPFSVAPGERPGPGDWQDVYTRDLAVESPGEPVAEGPFRRAAAAVQAYRVFPDRLVTGVLRRTPVAEGDTVGIALHALPGLDMFFAARVTETFDGPADRGYTAAGPIWRAGFTYRTLVGHPELGEETFSVEKELATGAVRAAMASWSRPGVALTRWFKPFARTAQVRANNAALANLARVAADPTSPAPRAPR
jgi:uncharacterized protein (UPF0548 family)